jgi:hypothetical protein
LSITNYGTAETDEFGGGLAFEYLATPNLSFGINGNYRTQSFPGDNTMEFGLEDSTEYGGGLSVSYLVTPRSKLGIVGSMQHYTYDLDVTTNSYFAGILFGYQFSPVLRLDLSVGGSMVREDDREGVEGRKDTSPSGSVILQYKTPDSDARFFGSALYTSGSGYGETERQITAGFSFLSRLSPEWSWNFSTAYQDSKSVFTEDAVSIRSLYGNAGIAYNPWQWITIDGRLSIDRQDSSGTFGTTTENYSAAVGVTLGKSLNLY